MLLGLRNGPFYFSETNLNQQYQDLGTTSALSALNTSTDCSELPLLILLLQSACPCISGGIRLIHHWRVLTEGRAWKLV